MKKTHYTDTQIDGMIHEIIRQMAKDNYRPDYVVGLTRGGLIPAVKISQYLEVPMETLKVSLRDGGECESNCWMAEDAFGYVPYEEQELIKSRWTPNRRKNILVVDDINDSGATLEWIKKDWQACCLPHENEVWDTIWDNNVRFATLIENVNSSIECRYSAVEINKAENPEWIVFPWENWWNV